MFIIIIIIIALLMFLYFKLKKKKIKLANCTLITGDIKTGKTMLAVYLACKTYKKILFRYYIRKYIFRKKEEKPLLYSNIPLAYVKNYVPLTRDLLLREKRFAYKSVALISESSLVADSQNYKDEYTNYNLTYFNKLFGHETKGGYLFYETQNVSDNHYSIKRIVSRYLWIYCSIKLPFFCLLKVREMYYSAENGSSSMNVFNEDVEEFTKNILISKKIWKKYDAYCYSTFTDKLPVSSDVIVCDSKNLKSNDILEIKKNIYLNKGGIEK